MKRLLLMVFLLYPLIMSAQKMIYFHITTINDIGNILPHCDLEFMLPGGNADIKTKTNEQGFAIISLKADSLIIVRGYCDHYLASVTNLQWYNQEQKNDTIYTKLVFKPMTTVLHGFYNIDFDTTYAIGEIANLKDTVIIVTGYDQIPPTEKYSVLKRTKMNEYELIYWFDRGEIVDPVEYRFRLKLDLKQNDDIELLFGDKKKTYHIRGLQTIYGLTYELISY